MTKGFESNLGNTYQQNYIQAVHSQEELSNSRKDRIKKKKE